MTALPRESAFVRAVAGDEATWGMTDHLLAANIETTDRTGRMIVAALGAKPVPDPITVPRPGDAARRHRARQRPSGAEMRAFFRGE